MGFSDDWVRVVLARHLAHGCPILTFHHIYAISIGLSSVGLGVQLLQLAQLLIVGKVGGDALILMHKGREPGNLQPCIDEADTLTRLSFSSLPLTSDSITYVQLEHKAR